MKLGIREKIVIFICIAIEAVFVEIWFRLSGQSFFSRSFDLIEPMVPILGG